MKVRRIIEEIKVVIKCPISLAAVVIAAAMPLVIGYGFYKTYGPRAQQVQQQKSELEEKAERYNSLQHNLINLADRNNDGL